MEEKEKMKASDEIERIGSLFKEKEKLE